MKNANILVALILFSDLLPAFDTGELRYSNSKSKTDIKHSVEVVQGILDCDLSCKSADDDLSVDDQSNIVLEVLQLVCTRIGCIPAPDSNPSIPTQQEHIPAIFKEGTPQFEAPGMLNGLIIET